MRRNANFLSRLVLGADLLRCRSRLPRCQRQPIIRPVLPDIIVGYPPGVA